jgi:hypothetical protein
MRLTFDGQTFQATAAPLPPAELLTPQLANFRIVDGKLQVGVPVLLNLYDLAQTTVPHSARKN